MTATDTDNKIKARDIVQGDHLSILTGALAAPSAVATQHVFGTVTATTPKALRVHLDAERGPPRGLWLPRRALTHLVRDRHGIRSKLGSWWQPNQFQARTLDACRHVAVLTGGSGG